MKKTILVLFLSFIVTFSTKAQVVITIADNATLEIKNGATLNAGGLELIPDYDYTINGPNHIERDLTSISIDEEVLKEDKEVVEDLMLVAVNQAINNISKKIEDTMNAATGGMLGKTNFPGI